VHVVWCSGQTGSTVGKWEFVGYLLSVLFTVAEWTWYVHADWFSGQTGRTGVKCWFGGDLRFVLFTVA
jgi:hypothetical protein